jgi:hypothetical protein
VRRLGVCIWFTGNRGRRREPVGTPSPFASALEPCSSPHADSEATTAWLGFDEPLGSCHDLAFKEGAPRVRILSSRHFIVVATSVWPFASPKTRVSPSTISAIQLPPSSRARGAPVFKVVL